MQAQPKGYYELKVGAEYITLDGKALPIMGLAGERRVGCFYLYGGNVGYVIKRREPTSLELYAAIQREKAARQAQREVAHCELDPGLWK